MKGSKQGINHESVVECVCVVTCVQMNVFTGALKPSMLWTYIEQESVFKVGEVLVTLFAAVPAVVLVYDLLVTV